ncbi:hypothetical protein [Aquisphaera insulae]|uniref:hypothetical protein n=1 Tax=Aquisphaera insulae TaxID=2712864 RepID=UPI0013EC620B|nr:hypothetical protein [Aquisphaera insulae]
MARIAAFCLSLALLIGFSGCTWTETRSDYPPEVSAGDGHHPGHPPAIQGEMPPVP